MLAAVLSALNPLGSYMDAQVEPAYCTSGYYFNDIEHVATTVNGHDYFFSFILGEGGLSSGFLGYGTYNFGNILSTDGKATANRVWMSVVCTRVWEIIPPFADPQSTLFEVEDTWGYTPPLVLNFTPPRDDDTDDCFLPQEGINPGRTPSTGPIRKNDVDCTGGGSSGGGDPTVTVYCLYYDYYDGDGNYLYSVLQGCWEE